MYLLYLMVYNLDPAEYTHTDYEESSISSVQIALLASPTSSFLAALGVSHETPFRLLGTGIIHFYQFFK
jgi:hypothetical protein